ncbi:hypothetical protein BDW22DRAFT_718275 [Trametopsis cervina]|nr:hypothetical protein BDW22DRAFT_718275 [Trametopsis cervina]
MNLYICEASRLNSILDNMFSPEAARWICAAKTARHNGPRAIDVERASGDRLDRLNTLENLEARYQNYRQRTELALDVTTPNSLDDICDSIMHSDTVGLQPADSLPIELIYRVLGYLNWHELATCRQLSRSFKHIIDTSPILQYTIQLHLAGMADNPHHPLNIIDKLTLLNTYHAQWYSLSAHLKQVTHPDGTQPWTLNWDHNFMHGILGLSGSLESDSYLTRLPSRIRGIPLKSWILRLQEYHITFSADPHQDLFVLVKMNFTPNEEAALRILELSTGKDHPGALHPSLPFPDPQIWSNQHQCKLRVNGLYVCIQYRELCIIWNWRTGKEAYRELDTASFAWVGPTHILLGSPGNAGVDVVCPPKLILVDLARREGGSSRCWKWTFLLPVILSQRDGLFGFSLVCEPVATRDYDSISVSDPPFHTAEEDSVVCLEAVEGKFRMFILVSRLFEVARGAEQSGLTLQTHTSAPVSIPWRVWGPRNTHLDDLTTSGSPYGAYGTRYVAFRRSTSELVVLDFNKRRARYKMHHHDGTEGNGTTKILGYDYLLWRLMVQDIGAVEEETADLPLDDGVDDQHKLSFIQSVYPFDLTDVMLDPMISEDAIVVIRKPENGPGVCDVYTL